MEAVVADDDGTWYGYYHNENPAVVCGTDRPRPVARIGAARSEDRGRTWRDLGIVIEAPTSSIACASPNRYVIGGVGDLSVMLERREGVPVFLLQPVSRGSGRPGVAVARMAWASRNHPVRRVWVWNDGAWLPPSGSVQVHDRRERGPAPGVDGDTAGTPLVATTQAWHDADGRVNAFWGPSVHWNAAIDRYVMLLNRARDENYAQEKRVPTSRTPRASTIRRSGQRPSGCWRVRMDYRR